MNPKMKRMARRAVKQYGTPFATAKIASVHHAINDRASLLPQLARAEGGKIGIVMSGMDCDYTKFLHARLISVPTLFKAALERDRAYMDAEGPLSVYYVKPSELPESYSRDLALEAFENGHPHYVSEAEDN